LEKKKIEGEAKLGKKRHCLSLYTDIVTLVELYIQLESLGFLAAKDKREMWSLPATSSGAPEESSSGAQTEASPQGPHSPQRFKKRTKPTALFSSVVCFSHMVPGQEKMNWRQRPQMPRDNHQKVIDPKD
jgi:hypothetical protein